MNQHALFNIVLMLFFDYIKDVGLLVKSFLASLAVMQSGGIPAVVTYHIKLCMQPNANLERTLNFQFSQRRTILNM